MTISFRKHTTKEKKKHSEYEWKLRFNTKPTTACHNVNKIPLNPRKEKMYEKGVFKSLQISEHCELHKYISNGEFVSHLLALLSFSMNCMFI